MRFIQTTNDRDARLIVSLFDHSGAWSQPYADAGYRVVRVDLQAGWDVFDIWPAAFEREHGPAHGVLAALPCTHFSGSGARWWAEKDADGRTAEAVRLAEHTLYLIEAMEPKWWVLENPVGRLERLVPSVGPKRMTFQPWHYGDPYTKRTCLWGEFNTDLPRSDVEPTEGSRMWRMPETKARQRLRSITPTGFAKAFFAANP
jgi:hypothetical protein